MNLINTNSNQDPYACSKCGSLYFQPVYVLVKMSRIQYPHLAQDSLQPIQTLRCIKCQTIPEQLDPLTQQNSTPTSNIIL